MRNIAEDSIAHLPRPSRRTQRFFHAQYEGFMEQYKALLLRVLYKKDIEDPTIMSGKFEGAMRAVRLKYHGSIFDLDKPRE